MAAKHFHPGQRWISESEPELGLGAVLRIGDRTVTVVFGASEATRDYAREHAPLRRVAFRVGDTIRDDQDRTWTVQSIEERDELIYYTGDHGECCETRLSNAISFSKPQDRLRSGQCDAPKVFDLRLAALRHQYRQRKSPVRGFLGGRIDLIPHQMAIASEVASRMAPRVLLADEVGLGKTIEACLILQRLLATGRAQRVLILLPDSLIHQWFVELLRRFNQWFHIFDEERCQALEEATPGCNPFLDDQLVLCPLSLLTKDSKRLEQAKEAGWDLLIVDEAHHLGWSPDAISPEYVAVETLSQSIPGLLLLTATPEQLGMASHFARLRLLDNDRFFDLEAFIKESEQYHDVAQLASRILDGQSLSKKDVSRLSKLLGEADIPERLSQIQAGEPGVRDALIASLLDQHGTSRVIFRNTRASIPGFPKRTALLAPLACASDAMRKTLAKEWLSDTDRENTSNQPSLEKDPRIEWLAELLHELGSEKVLLVCRTRRKAEAIEAALKQRLKLSMAVFHEGLSLVQRDRGAAWFADPEGARLLICSEIGSEGRNFQFAHHLVLFDLPLDPSLLEQRIGRLDRIGQHSEIQIHVPFVAGSAQEVLARWYHEGLDAFEQNLPGGRELLERFGEEIRALAPDFKSDLKSPARKKLDALIQTTQATQSELKTRLEEGRDRLLELNSLRPELSESIIQSIRQQDEDTTLETFLLALLEHFFVEIQELAPRTYQLGSSGVLTDSFPGLPSEGLTFTCDRSRALAREDIQFLTWDHPFVSGALDLLLGSQKGNSSFARWPDAKTTSLYMEAVFVLECVAPLHLHVDRFLPPTPLRVLVDHRGEDMSAPIPALALAKILKPGDGASLLERPELGAEWIPKLIRQAHGLVAKQAPKLILRARREMAASLDPEIARLRDLQRMNRSVRDAEIQLLVEQRQTLDQHLAASRFRLDSVRLIHRGM